MSEGKRPGGLTALAVLNFILGGFGALALPLMFAALAVVQTERGQAAREDVSEASRSLVSLQLVLIAVACILLIASGVGYLRQKRFLGRTLGNVYAIIALISSALGILVLGDVQLLTIVGLVYPVLTLFLLNTTFKDDLVL